jgi:hypothetical protein
VLGILVDKVFLPDSKLFFLLAEFNEKLLVLSLQLEEVLIISPNFFVIFVEYSPETNVFGI